MSSALPRPLSCGEFLGFGVVEDMVLLAFVLAMLTLSELYCIRLASADT